jgi:uncharacterized protein YjbI with pentapeptide repeats
MTKRDKVVWYYSPIWISIIIFVAAAAFVIIVTGFKILIIKPDFTWGLYNKSFLLNVLVEAHGTLFDILLVSVLMLVLNKITEKQLAKQDLNIAYLDNIEDYRGLASEEAAYKIAGNVRRINRSGEGNIDLSLCYLAGTNLQKVNLVGSHLQKTNFNGANLTNANLSNATISDASFQRAGLEGAIFQGAGYTNIKFEKAMLGGADFRGAKLTDSYFQEAYLRNANFEGARLDYAHFQKSKLQCANLKNTNLEFANFQEAKLKGVDFQGANLAYANLQNTEDLDIQQLAKAKTLYEAKLDYKFMKQIKEKYPHLLEKPKSDE